MEVLKVVDNSRLNYQESPIYHLPVELLQQIFLFIVHDIPNYPSIFSKRSNPVPYKYVTLANFAAPPLLFTRVCHLWRVVAYSTPGIWSRIYVDLPGEFEPLKPSLPSLLRFWLAQSGDQPLTLRIHLGRPYPIGITHSERPQVSQADSQLLDILFFERGRWETVNFVPSVYNWNVKLDTLDTPQLRTLDCYLSDLRGLNAPNLSRLRVRGYVPNFPSGPTPTTTNIRHVHLNYASVRAICSTAVIFPHMKTLAVDHINDGSESDLVTRSCLGIQSMTLPVFPHAHNHIQPKIITIFNGLHLPMLQNLILVGKPKSRTLWRLWQLHFATRQYGW